MKIFLYRKNGLKIIKTTLIIIFIFLSLILEIDIHFYIKYYGNKNINKHKIAIVFGTRPEAIKMIPIIKQFKKNKYFKCITINTGQHQKMIDQILQSLNMSDSIDIKLNIMKKNQTLAELTSKTIVELNKIYSSIHPDAVVVQGDTTTSFSAALSAFYLKIPVFHVEAGLRTQNIYSPFPEEFNRIGIDDISSLYFAATELSANNLIKENKNPRTIFITGNTIVDTLKFTLSNTSPSGYIQKMIKTSLNRCNSKNHCKIILLTCHRRENYFEPIINILKAVQILLNNFDNIVIILPLHLNPNIRQSVKMGLPEQVYNDIIHQKEIRNPNYLYFNRFLLINPLNYIDLIHLQSSCFFVMTDSGGIQEEAISIGRPVLILRENTEREEGIKIGSAVLTGTNPDKIVYYASMLLNNNTLYNRMALSHNVYGYGNSSKIIVNIIEHFFGKISVKTDFNNTRHFLNSFNYNKIISQYDNFVLNSVGEFQYDLVIVLTVWKKNNLNQQLIQIKRQSILKKKKTNIIVFQNSNHINVDNIIKEWEKPGMFFDSVKITFIKSPIETGYYGRFISPLTSQVTTDAYFIVCDDDIIWGDKYFENMLRVVDEGHLATRNGRIIDNSYNEIGPHYKIFMNNSQVCFNEDIEYDFGGHIWAGRILWLRNAWSHIPISLENCEDFWLSSTLKTFYNISTRTPKCPCPKKNLINPELCAASDVSAIYHINSIIGKKLFNNSRAQIIKDIVNYINYKPLILSEPNIMEKINNKFVFGNAENPLFDLSDNLWDHALFWQ